MYKLSLKTLLSVLMISVALSLPVMAGVEAIEVPFENAMKTEYKTKVGIGRRALAMKFLMAMLGVGASSVIIYVGLSVYNRFIYGTPRKKQFRTEDEDYKTPNNMKDALEIFLKKTK